MTLKDFVRGEAPHVGRMETMASGATALDTRTGTAIELARSLAEGAGVFATR